MGYLQSLGTGRHLQNKIIIIVLPCILYSFLVSGELGDHDPMTCRSGYLSEYQFFPNQVCTSWNSNYVAEIGT